MNAVNRPRRTGRILAISAALLLLGLVAAALGLNAWLNSADLRGRLEREAGAALGVPVRVAQAGVGWWPLPGVTLGGVELATPRPLKVGEVQARPSWAALLGGTLLIERIEVRDADIAQTAVAQLQQAMERAARQRQPRAGSAPPPAAAPALAVRHIGLRNIRWTAQSGWSSTVDADAELGAPDGMAHAAEPMLAFLPVRVDVRVSDGRFKGARLQLLPAQPAAAAASPAAGSAAATPGAGRHWTVDARIGGGSITGPLALLREGRGWRAQGDLQTQGVEVSALTAPARPLAGRLEARTRVSGEAAQLAGLADALTTFTPFTVHDAVLNGIDLARAVSTVGMSRGGQTGFERITGKVSTRGRAVSLTEVVAGSALLSARADVNISAAQALSGKVVVDVAGGVAGVPLVIGGTLDQPEVSLSRSALVGAALGTAVMPGVGTGAGARLGDRIGEGFKGLFGK